MDVKPRSFPAVTGVFRSADPARYSGFRNTETNKREMGQTQQMCWAFPRNSNRLPNLCALVSGIKGERLFLIWIGVK